MYPDASHVIVRTPPPERARAYRQSLTDFCEFVVEDYGPGVVSVAPREGLGRTRPYFKSVRLCDGATPIDSDAWQPLRDHPRLPPPNDERRHGALSWAGRVATHAADDDIESRFRAIAATLAVLSTAETCAFLDGQMPSLFESFPEGALWLIAVDPTLIRRMTFRRAQLAYTLTPDIPFAPEEFEGLRLLGSHSLTQDLDYSDLFHALALCVPPSARGFAMTIFPHVLFFTFGEPFDIETRRCWRWDRMYEPMSHDTALRPLDRGLNEIVTASDFELLVPWWTAVVDGLYRRAADPTQWVTGMGFHDPVAQTAFLLSVERLLADLILVLGSRDGPGLTRLQLAFDLLDKCETLVRYGTNSTNLGFKRFLDRSVALRWLAHVLSRLPAPLARPFGAHARRLFDDLYAGMAKGVLAHRRTTAGVLVGHPDTTALSNVSMNQYVGDIIRSVRNSSHGLRRELADSPHLLATHTGDVPWEFGDLVATIAFAVCIAALD
jgi:hypothetical protein